MKKTGVVKIRVDSDDEKENSEEFVCTGDCEHCPMKGKCNVKGNGKCTGHCETCPNRGTCSVYNEKQEKAVAESHYKSGFKDGFLEGFAYGQMVVLRDLGLDEKQKADD